MYDLVITNGRVFDGKGNPWFWGEIGVKDGRIQAVARIRPGEAGALSQNGAPVLDAGGHAVSPGFIDMHSHSDYPLLVNPTADSKIMQGVTMEVVGQCGGSVAPVTPTSLPLLKVGRKGMPETEWDWRSFGQYLDRVQSQGVAVNVVALVGHGTIRMGVMGYDRRAPSKEEFEQMRRMVRDAVSEGAYGLSTGLIYAPGSYADTEEITGFAQECSDAGGLYFTHLRAEGEKVLSAIEEALEVGRRARIPVQIAHLKAFGLARGRGADVLALLARARSEGVDVTADQYPYAASSTGLAAFLPSWVHEGGREKMVERLADPSLRPRIKADMLTGHPDWANDFRVPWTEVQVSKCEDQSLEGRRIQEIAGSVGKDPWVLVFDLLSIVDAGTSVVIHGMDEADVELIMRSEMVTVGSDGSALNPVGPLGQGQPHPRNYGTMPRVLARYVREKKVLTLPEAIRKMTSAQAARLGLRDRGEIREGCWADIVVFDPERIKDMATFERPHQFPQGIEWVMVNGVVAVRDGRHTGALAGKVLRKA